MKLIPFMEEMRNEKARSNASVRKKRQEKAWKETRQKQQEKSVKENELVEKAKTMIGEPINPNSDEAQRTGRKTVEQEEG